MQPQILLQQQEIVSLWLSHAGDFTIQLPGVVRLGHDEASEAEDSATMVECGWIMRHNTYRLVRCVRYLLHCFAVPPQQTSTL